jgi:hypothetical protein
MTLKKQQILSTLAALLAILLSACANNSTHPAPPSSTPQTQFIVITATPPPATDTPDRCAPENIEAEAQKIHAHMREFDDASTLAASRPRQDLAESIAELQRIRREAEDQPAPTCLATLKTHQISHMNSVINTLVAFMSGVDQTVIDQGIAFAREEHDRYTLELARLLGITVVPATSIITPAQTPTP